MFVSQSVYIKLEQLKLIHYFYEAIFLPRHMSVPGLVMKLRMASCELPGMVLRNAMVSMQGMHDGGAASPPCLLFFLKRSEDLFLEQNMPKQPIEAHIL